MSETDPLSARITQLESRVEELAMVQDLLLRLISMTRPLAAVLEQFGATETQQQAFYRMLDDVAARAKGPEPDRPSFAHFRLHIAKIFPELRDDHQFLHLLIDTLKVERPAYRDLHRYIVEQGWSSGEERS